MRKNFIISCDDATSICDKSQYGEASTWDKIRLNFHLFMCKHCSAYSKQNRIISKILGRHLESCDGSKKMSVEEKEELKENLNHKINK